MGEIPASDWISFAALFITASMALTGYLRKKPFVSLSAMDELRNRHRECEENVIRLTSRIAMLEARIVILEAQITMTMQREQFWSEEYRKLRGLNEKK